MTIAALPEGTATASSPADVAQQLLCESPYHSIRRLTCGFSAGTLTIAGCVPTYYLKQLAQIAVQHLDGVQRISNLIQVST